MLYACGGPLGAAEQATAPCRALCESLGLTFEGDAAARPRELAFSTRSELPDATPADIRLALRVGDEAIAIPVGADGRFMLPLDRKWFDADAVLVSNQPKGTWVLSCDVKQKLTAEEIAFTAVSPHVKDGRIPYVALVRLAHDSRRRLLEQVLEKQVGRDVAQRMTLTLSDNSSWQCMLIDRHADDVGSPESSGTAPTIANP